MTNQQAERAANIVIGLGVLAAAFVVLSNPSLRRSLVQLVRNGARATGPWLAAEARHAWHASRDEIELEPPRDSAVGQHAI